MKFSRITLRPDAPRHDLVRTLRQGYAAHQLVWRWFESDARHFVMRQETQPRGTTFFVVSRDAPTTDPRIWQQDTKEYAPQLESGDLLHFSLRANPTVSVCVKEGKRGQRHDVVMHMLKNEIDVSRLEAVQRAGSAWLQARGERHGFEILADTLQIENYQQQRLFKKGGAPIRFSTLDFRGTLKVLVPTLFTQTLFEGIGRAKSFGCGLMLVRRA